MSLDELIVFARVVEAKSFTAAGEKLGLPKSTVSQKIARLEKRLGVQLLARSTRQVRPTDLGVSYYERCVRAIAEIEDAELALRRAHQAPRGLIRMTAPVEFSVNFLGPLIGEFVGQYPEVQVQVDATSRLVDLVEEGVDIAIRVNLVGSPSLIARKVLAMHRGLYASPGYLKNRGKPKQPTDLRRHSCLWFPTGGRIPEWTLVSATGKRNVPISGSIAANNYSLLRDAAIAGAGIALLPSYICRDAVSDKRLVPVLAAWRPEDVPLYLFHPTRRYLSSAIQSFMDFIASRLASRQNQLSFG
ncbi:MULTISPECIES: LysR family transcriptional regulator [unclassified Bradyrhizobium]|uniref:LysR family transcriptional regulator n=1 Tax=unclassified Bradyrhizobium TaxID=2631580 RepID=UPI0005661DCE|nr:MULTISPECIES: LysR family transcriptional regulator [unclassified Bradyrhizobium]QIG92576.1 LysR family transcriptional regulator [Bradyrhizobium sp. 6(2017)]